MLHVYVYVYLCDTHTYIYNPTISVRLQFNKIVKMLVSTLLINNSALALNRNSCRIF